MGAAVDHAPSVEEGLACVQQNTSTNMQPEKFAFVPGACHVSPLHRRFDTARAWNALSYATILFALAGLAYLMAPEASFTSASSSDWGSGADMVPSQLGYAQATARDIHQLMGLSQQPQLFQISDADPTAAQVLQHIHSYSAMLVITTGARKPERRAPDQPFLTMAPGLPLPAAAINTAAGLLESALGRRLFPMTVDTFDRTCPDGPVVIYEVGSGLILVDRALARRTWGREEVQYLAGALANATFSHLALLLPKGSSLGLPPFPPTSLIAAALALAIPAAFTAAPPLWFCIACPTVLGLVAPLVINLGLGQLAGVLCTRMQLPDEQCYDLLLGALGLGFVLSLASAVPIFFVCQLAQCAHRDLGVRALLR